jgi:hypothetical protein
MEDNMVPDEQTIVTNEELEKKNEAHSVKQEVPFAVTDAQVSEEKNPAVAGGFPTENYPKASNEALKNIGEAEAVKESAQKFTLNTNKFNTLVKNNSTRTLLRIKSAKILDFFPSEVTIETTKVNVSQRDYFFLRRLHTVAIEDIEDVFVETTPIYATLKIVDKGFVENTIQVQFLKKNDAKKARRIIQGLVSAFKEDIDIATLPKEGLVEKLETLGSAGEVENIHS